VLHCFVCRSVAARLWMACADSGVWAFGDSRAVARWVVARDDRTVAEERPAWRGGIESGWHGLVTDPRHGSLPVLLVVLTVVTGVVDAVSILSLGRVFVANMTGNVVFVGFALAGAPGFSLSASVFALAGFLVGAAAGGALAGRLGARRVVLLRTTSAGELALLVLAMVIAVVAGAPFGAVSRAAIAAAVAVAMGTQNAVARRLAVPDLTTTVLTMTLTGLAADMRASGWSRSAFTRIAAVLAMLLGAVTGTLLVLHVSPEAALGLAVVLLALVTAAATWTARPKR
jgi:uncharacterized membrane protein YoaK (UPF0700 family)